MESVLPKILPFRIVICKRQHLVLIIRYSLLLSIPLHYIIIGLLVISFRVVTILVLLQAAGCFYFLHYII